jgi:hypothetical protein
MTSLKAILREQQKVDVNGSQSTTKILNRSVIQEFFSNFLYIIIFLLQFPLF